MEADTRLDEIIKRLPSAQEYGVGYGGAQLPSDPKAGAQPMIGLLEKLLGPSRKTSLYGIGAVLAVAADIVVAYAQGKTPNWEADVGIILSGFGLSQAKDRNVSNASHPVDARVVHPDKAAEKGGS